MLRELIPFRKLTRPIKASKQLPTSLSVAPIFSYPCSVPPIKKPKEKKSTFNEFYIVKYWKSMVTSKGGNALIVLLTNGEVGIKDTEECSRNRRMYKVKV